MFTVRPVLSDLLKESQEAQERQKRHRKYLTEKIILQKPKNKILGLGTWASLLLLTFLIENSKLQCIFSMSVGASALQQQSGCLYFLIPLFCDYFTACEIKSSLAVLFCAVQLSEEALPTGETLWVDNSVIKSRIWCILDLQKDCSCFTEKGRILYINKYNSFQIIVNFWWDSLFVSISDSIKDLFYLMNNSQIQSDQNYSLPYQQYWVFRQKYSAEEALLWCLTRCAQEEEFCRMADLQSATDKYFVCTLYPEAQICDSSINQVPGNCATVLPWQPQTLYHKIVTLKSSVKSFYTRVPFQKVTEISVRNKTDMSKKAVSDGFFECERWCDADPCCTGFGFFNDSQLSGGKIVCVTMNSLGIQTCAEETRSSWHISDCSSPDAEVKIHPFGWYQKP
ncbi:hypothetical protein DV515_00000552, partial [Chloebia gouldiae]